MRELAMVKTFSDPNRMKYAYGSTGAYQMRTSGNVTGIRVSGGKSDNTVTEQLAEIQRVGPGLKDLKSQCFKDCTILRNADLTDSDVRTIGDDCFAGCSQLADVRVCEGLSEIGDRAFSGCAKLSAVTFDWLQRDSAGGMQFQLTSVGSNAFSECQALANTVFPCGVECLGQNSLNGASLSGMTFTGSSSQQLTSSSAARTKMFGLGQPCEIITNDGKIVAFDGAALSVRSDFPGSSGVAQAGTAGKLRLGRIYALTDALANWCAQENVPYVVIYCDTMTDFGSRDICQNVLRDQAFRKFLSESFKYFILFADRNADFAGAGEAVSCSRRLASGAAKNPNPDDMRFTQLSFIYNGAANTAVAESGTDADGLKQLLLQYAKATGFESWDNRGYDNQVDIPDDETVPAGSPDPAGMQAYGIPPWFSGGQAETPGQWDAASSPADFRLVSTPDTTYLLLFANDANNGMNGMDGDNIWGKSFFADYSDHVNVINGSSSTKSKLIMALQEGCKYHLLLFKESCHGGGYSAKDYCEFIGIYDYTAKKREIMYDYEFADALKNAKNRVFGIFQSCESGTMFDDETPNTNSPAFKAAAAPKGAVSFGEGLVRKMNKIRREKLAALAGEGPEVQSTLDVVNAIFWSPCTADTSTYYYPGGGQAPNSLFLIGLDAEFKKLTLPRYMTLWEKMRTNADCTCADCPTQCVPQVHTFGDSFKTGEAFR